MRAVRLQASAIHGMMRTVNGVILSLASALPLFADPAAERKSLPTRVKLLNWGQNPTAAGLVIVDDKTAQVFSANQKAIGRERVQVDFEHNTVPGTAEYNRTQEPRPVAGHSTLVCIPNEGIFAEAVTYTADGQKAALNYEDVSLAPYLDKERRVIAAHSWTVTHTGAAYGLDFKEATTTTLSADLRILSSNATISSNNTMPEKFLSIATLAGLLSLSADADEAAITTELKKRLTPILPSTPNALSADAMSAAITAALTPLTAKITALETSLAAGETARMELKRAELTTLFSTQGKVPLKKDGKAYTADELKALPVDTLELLLANTAVTVPLSARNEAHQTETKKSYRVKVGDKEVVDLGAIFDAEARASGLSATPPAAI